MNSQFEVKRGMVFYMDVPSKDQPVPLPGEKCITKKRPYIVLSNDYYNEKSTLIHVAPITTKPPAAPKWYLVPFRKRDSTYNWIDIGLIMLVPKTYANQADYSESLSYVTFNNSDLFERLNYCIAKQFGFENIFDEKKGNDVMPITVNNDSNVSSDVVKVDTTQIPNGVVIPNINITINLPGFSTPVTVTPEVVSEPEVVSKSEVKKAKSKTVTSSVKTSKKPLGRNGFGKQKKAKIMTAVKTLSRAFNGNMTNAQVAEACGVSLATVSRYKKELSEPGYKRPELRTATKKKAKSTTIDKTREVTKEDFPCNSYVIYGNVVSQQLLIDFLNYYRTHTADECFNVYHNLFETKSHMSKTYWSKMLAFEKRKK